MTAITVAQLADTLRVPHGVEQLVGPCGGGAVVVDVSDADDRARADLTELATSMSGVAGVLVAIGGPQSSAAHAFDVIVEDPSGAADIVRAVDRNPLAATSLAMLLRGGLRRTVAEGLVAESSTYSLLQAGPEHRAWLASQSRKAREPDEGSPVRVRLVGHQLHITLDRPQKRNAYNAATRDALLDALAVAASDPSVDVVIDGEGPSFCSGGDLDEFGTLADPATAHVLRLARSAARAMHELASRVVVNVHGACIGAGIELPAFAARIVAREDATFALPEVSMGLVPGAGGTVSIPRRIGRHRAAWLALTGQRIDALTALAWGLVDEVA
jgi:hypothetical protein